MRKMMVGAAAAMLVGLAGTAGFAQQKAPDGKAPEAKKIEVPKDTFYAGLGPTQYLIKSRLIGATVVDKSGGRLGTIDDVILGTKDDKIDGFLLDAGGGKKIGVRITVAKIESKDGKTTVTLPTVTSDMLKVLPPFGAKK